MSNAGDSLHENRTLWGSFQSTWLLHVYSPASYTAGGFLCMITYFHPRRQKLKDKSINQQVGDIGTVRILSSRKDI